MIFKKKLFNPKKKEFNKIEKEVLNCLANNIPKQYATKLRNQFQYLNLINRVKYKSSMVVELYPEKYGSIPESFLFERKEEFRLAVMKYIIDEEVYSSEIHMVSGRVFDIKIRPIPSNRIAKDASFALKSIKIERNLDTNIYGPKAI